ncbi:MAG: glycosyltransferase family 1 protein [Deltaproteobacteria bacterium]|nr:glycosyltransferase family 1 protein [Deltaproteobacteria bacterium]
MRILVDAIPLNNIATGISRYLRCLYTALGRNHPKAEIAWFDGRGLRPDMPQGPADQASWSLMARIFWKLPPGLALMVRMAVHRRRQRAFFGLAQGFDVYHEAGFFPFAAPNGTRTVFTLHDVSIMRFPQHHPRERVLYYDRCLGPGLDRTDAFLTVSEFSAREIKDVLGIDRKRITVTPLAHDPQLFRPVSKPEIERVRTKHGLPERYFLFVGSGDPRKNTAVLPKALARSGLDIPLVRAGWSGWDNASGPGQVIRLGHVPDKDLAGLYAGALAFVFPSIYEGFGLPVLEAMSCGCPVLCSDRASLPEVGGDAVLYCRDPENPGAWVEPMLRVAKDRALRDDLSRKGLARAREFSWNRTADTTWKVLKGNNRCPT